MKRRVLFIAAAALLLIVFFIGLLAGENLRDFLYGQPVAENETASETDLIPANPQRKPGKKWKRYSGLFVLLKQKWSLSDNQKTAILEAALTIFRNLVQPRVRSFV